MVDKGWESECPTSATLFDDQTIYPSLFLWCTHREWLIGRVAERARRLSWPHHACLATSLANCTRLWLKRRLSFPCNPRAMNPLLLAAPSKAFSTLDMMTLSLSYSRRRQLQRDHWHHVAMETPCWLAATGSAGSLIQRWRHRMLVHLLAAAAARSLIVISVSVIFFIKFVSLHVLRKPPCQPHLLTLSSLKILPVCKAWPCKVPLKLSHCKTIAGMMLLTQNHATSIDISPSATEQQKRRPIFMHRHKEAHQHHSWNGLHRVGTVTQTQQRKHLSESLFYWQNNFHIQCCKKTAQVVT